MGLQTKIQKQRSSYSNGSHLVLHTWRKCSKVAARSRPCYLCLLIGKVLSLMSTPLQAKLLLNSTTSMFFTGWEMQYEETNCSYGNWRLAASSQPCACSCIMSCAEFFGKTSNHPGDSAPPTAQIWCLATSVFFQNQNHLWKGRDFRLSMRFGKIWEVSWLQFQTRILQSILNTRRDAGAPMWGPKVPTLKGTEASLSYAQCFLCHVSSINVYICHTTWHI